MARLGRTDRPPSSACRSAPWSMRNAELKFRDELKALDDFPDDEETRRKEQRPMDQVQAQLELEPLAEINVTALANVAHLSAVRWKECYQIARLDQRDRTPPASRPILKSEGSTSTLGAS